MIHEVDPGKRDHANLFTATLQEHLPLSSKLAWGSALVSAGRRALVGASGRRHCPCWEGTSGLPAAWWASHR